MHDYVYISSCIVVQGKSLASVTVVGDPDCSDAVLESRVRAHLTEWFDKQESGVTGKAGEGGDGGREGTVPTSVADVSEWRHLRTYRVPYAQPAQTPPVGEGGFYGREVQVGQRGHEQDITTARQPDIPTDRNRRMMPSDIYPTSQSISCIMYCVKCNKNPT